VIGPPDKVNQFVGWAEVYVKLPEVRGMRLETLEAGRPEMRQTLDRAEKFLHLVALLAALLSAVAVALAISSNHFSVAVPLANSAVQQVRREGKTLKWWLISHSSRPFLVPMFR
jgi:hypothetical protein